MNVEEYLKKNCSLHVLGLLGQNPDDPITSKDFRYIVTLIEQIISERDKEINTLKGDLFEANEKIEQLQSLIK